MLPPAGGPRGHHQVGGPGVGYAAQERGHAGVEEGRGGQVGARPEVGVALQLGVVGRTHGTQRRCNKKNTSC